MRDDSVVVGRSAVVVIFDDDSVVVGRWLVVVDGSGLLVDLSCDVVAGSVVVTASRVVVLDDSVVVGRWAVVVVFDDVSV